MILVGLLWVGLLSAPASAQNLPTSTKAFTVEGSAPAHLLKKSIETGRLSPNQPLGRMVLLLARTPQQEQAAAKLVAAQHDPASPSFHQWLTPAQFGKQFGASEEQTLQVKRWLESQGLTVHQVAQSRRFVIFSGNVAQVETAFSTQMHSYSYNEKPFISNATDIRIPAALRSIVKGVVRLNSEPASPNISVGKKIPFQKKNGQFTFGDGSHFIAPADFASIYNVKPLYNAGIDGTGQTIAIVGRSNIDVQNVRDFRNLLGLPVNDPEIIVNGDNPGQNSDVFEAMIDVTWSGAVAPGAHIKFVVSQSNFADGIDVSAAYIVDNNLAPVMSTSYGQCELTMSNAQLDFYNSLWQQAAAQGITSFVSSGDNGGAGCDAPSAGYYSSGVFAVNGIASTPYNVAVGGTQFDDTDSPDTYWSTNTDPVTGQSALGYIPEKAWNESSNDPNGVLLFSGSGGASAVYAKPDWQVGNGVPADGLRDIPDLSLSASLHDGYLFCVFNYCSSGDYFYSAGGTSVSSPAAAGIMALVNQKLGGQPQGLANYVFYRLASVPGVFHDTIKGDNKVPDPSGLFTVGYDATPGYDLATGLGSLDVNALVNHWKDASTGGTPQTTLALGSGQKSAVAHGTPIAFTATVSCGGACTTPTGLVALSATSAAGSTVGIGSATLDSTGVANLKPASIPGGKYNVAARYNGDAKNLPGVSATVPVSITPESSQTFVGALAGGSFTQAPISVEYGLPWKVGIAVAGNSGYGYPSGNLSLTADGQPLVTEAFDAGTGNLTPSSLTLNYGEKSTLLTGGPTSQSSSISYVVPSKALAAGSHTLVANYPGDPSFGSSQGSFSYNVAKAQSAIVDFFPIGTQVANVPVKLAGQVGFTNQGYAPYDGTITISDITAAPVVLGTSPLSSLYGGSYTVPVTVTTPGTHILRVDFSGDTNVKAGYQTYTVPFPANSYSYTSLAANTPNSYAGQPVTLTANVGSDVRLHNPTGMITFLNGSATIGTAALDASGNATLVTSSLPAGASNLTASFPGDSALQPSASSPIVNTVADFVLQPLPPILYVQDGQSGSTTLNLTPLGGFAQPVTLACANLPANTLCSFTSSSVTLDGIHPSPVALVISTGSAVAGVVKKDSPWTLPTSLAIAGIFLIPFRKRKWMKWTASSMLLLAIGLGGIGCSSSGANNKLAPVGSYNIQITATSVAGTAPKTVTVVLNVTK